MGITTVLNQFRELATLELHPSQSFISSSQEIASYKWGPATPGITGSIELIARPSKVFKSFPPPSIVLEGTDVPHGFDETFDHGPYFFSEAIKNELGRPIPEGSDLTMYFASPPHGTPSDGLLFDVNNSLEEKKNKKKFNIRRFRPPYKYSQQVGGYGAQPNERHLSGTDLGIKLYVQNVLMPSYKNVYTNSQMAYTNYSVLNFFTASNVPSDSVLIYPNFTGSLRKVGTYARDATADLSAIPTPSSPFGFSHRTWWTLPWNTSGYQDETLEAGHAPYTPSGSFSISFYINPRYTVLGPTGRNADDQSIGGNPFHAGTVMHLSSTFAVSLVSGSAVSNDGMLDGYRIMLQLSQSADSSPSKVAYKTGSSQPISRTYPNNLIFLSEDNSLRHNMWHHVAIRWGTSTVNEGSGSILIDGIEKGTFNVPSSTITPYLELQQGPGTGEWETTSPYRGYRKRGSKTDSDALFIGNYYEGTNQLDKASGGKDDRIVSFFNVDAFWREGLSDTPVTKVSQTPLPSRGIARNMIPWTTQSNPTCTFRHGLNAEIHDVRIYNKYISMDELVTGSQEGPPDNDYVAQGLIFYLPVFFTKDHAPRLALYNAVQNFHPSPWMPTFLYLTYDDTQMPVSEWNGFRFYLDGRGGMTRDDFILRDSSYDLNWAYWYKGATWMHDSVREKTDTLWAGAYPNQHQYNYESPGHDGMSIEALNPLKNTIELANTAAFYNLPFNGAAAMATGYGLSNLEGFTREFVQGQSPRLLHLTESSVQDKNYNDDGGVTEASRPNNFSRVSANVGRINVPGVTPCGISTVIQRSELPDGSNSNRRFHHNYITPVVSSSLDQWYATGSLIKRNLSVLPCDNGLFKPNFNLLLSSSVEVLAGTGSNYMPKRGAPMGLFVNSNGTLNLEVINIQQILDNPPVIPEIVSTENNLLSTLTGSWDCTMRKGSDPDWRNKNITWKSSDGPCLGIPIVNSYDGSDDLVSPDNPDGRAALLYDKGNGYGFLRYGLAGGDNSSPEVSIFTISDLYYGQQIEPGSVTITDPYYTGSNGKIGLTLKDDSYGGLYRADSKTPHATWNNVGNIFYNEGVAIVKSPQISQFGKDYFKMDMQGIQSMHISTLNVYAGEGMINSSSNPSYLPLSATLNANDTAPEFVYITSINLHDNNMNVVARANLAQPILKRFVEGFNFKIKVDY